MQRKRQLMDSGGSLDLRAEINDHVFQLNKALGRMLADARALERCGRSLADPDPDFDRPLADIRQEIDAVYRTMVRIRWAALGVPPSLVSGRSSGANPTGGPAGPLPRGQATIYVVDDDPSVRKALSRLFRSVDYRVETFASLLQFLGAEAGARPACLVLDVRMPRLGGIDLHRELTARRAEFPIVFITGHPDMELAVRAVKDGAVDLLPRPFDDQDLLDAVARALRSHPSMGPVPSSDGTV